MIHTDQLMREMRIENPPSRIISLVPSLTELVCDLGLEDRLCGITKFCIHPGYVFQTKVKIGGTKNPDLSKILALEPDLVIANKEENRESDIAFLEKHTAVWVSDISSLDNALVAIKKLGALLGCVQKSNEMCDLINYNFQYIESADNLSTLYLIWKNPYMAAAGDTFINDMLRRCGMINLLSDEQRYPELTADQIRELNPELVLLSSEPYPFSEKHIAELQNILPSSKIILVNGEYFSWYGSRMAAAPSYFNSITGKLKNIQA